MPLTTTPQRCPHQPPDTYRLGAIFCPSCGWVKNGLRMTTEQVIAQHPELRAQVQANEAQQAIQRSTVDTSISRGSSLSSASDRNLVRMASTGNPITRTFAWLVLGGKMIVWACFVLLMLFVAYAILAH
jgi:hypothetical protein